MDKTKKLFIINGYRIWAYNMEEAIEMAKRIAKF